MHRLMPAALLLVACAVSTPSIGQKLNADDVKWINQCIDDNKGESGGTPPIVRAYCFCMNEKMDNNETRSITQWEKSHPAARTACEKQAGWK